MDNLFQHFTCVAAVLPAAHKLNVGGYPLLNGGLSSSAEYNNVIRVFSGNVYNDKFKR